MAIQEESLLPMFSLRHQMLAPGTDQGRPSPARSASQGSDGHDALAISLQEACVTSGRALSQGAGTLAPATPCDLVYMACWQSVGS